MTQTSIKLIVGLGNPGASYEATRHNIGFAILEELCHYFKQKLEKEKKFDAQFCIFEHEFSYTLQETIKEQVVELVKNPISQEEHELQEQKKNLEQRKAYQEKIEKLSYVKKKIKTQKTKKQKLIFAKPQSFMNNSGKSIAKIMNFYKLTSKNLLLIHDDVSLDFGKLKLSINRGAGGQHGVEDTIAQIGSKDFARLKYGVGPDPGGAQRAQYVLSKFAKKDQELLSSTNAKALELITAWILEEDHQQISRV
jgi:aminoacyl-tRNA hydrolase